jgi:hypothetical protein
LEKGIGITLYFMQGETVFYGGFSGRFLLSTIPDAGRWLSGVRKKGQGGYRHCERADRDSGGEKDRFAVKLDILKGVAK